MLVFSHLPQIRGMSKNWFMHHKFLWYLRDGKRNIIYQPKEWSAIIAGMERMTSYIQAQSL
jgi:hypothetical protein